MFSKRKDYSIIINIKKHDVLIDDPVDQEIEVEKKKFLGTIQKQLSNKCLFIKDDLDLSFTTVRRNSSAFGGLLSDLMRIETGSYFAFTNAGEVRADKVIKAGSLLSLEDIFNTLPFMSPIAVN